MPTVFLTPDNIRMIEYLLSEIWEAGPALNQEQDTTAIRHFAMQAFESGSPSEAELRIILTEYAKTHGILGKSYRRWASDRNAPFHRQEHMLPSPEEEFNSAESIASINSAPHVGIPIVGRNSFGETAKIRWIEDPMHLDGVGHWINCDTGTRFGAVHWVVDSHTEQDGSDSHVDEPSSVKTSFTDVTEHRFLPFSQIDCQALDNWTNEGGAVAPTSWRPRPKRQFRLSLNWRK